MNQMRNKKKIHELSMINNDDSKRSRQQSKYRYELAQSTNTQQLEQQHHQSYHNNNNKCNHQLNIDNTYQLQSLINKQLIMATNNNKHNFTTHSRMFRNKKINNTSPFHTHSNQNSIDKQKHSQSPFLIWRKTHYSFKQKNHQKHLSKQQTNVIMYSTNQQQQPYTNTNTNNTNNLEQIRQSLTVLKTKQQYLSPKRSYDQFINRLNRSTTANPQTKQQLIKELEVSKLGNNIVLDRQKKSFSVCHKEKSKGMKDKIGWRWENCVIEGDDDVKNIQQQQQYFVSSRVFFDNVTPCKISSLKPIRIHPHEKRKNLNTPPSSQLQNLTRYRAKKSNKMPQPKLNQRQKSSRQVLSPYHNELSAWS